MSFSLKEPTPLARACKFPSLFLFICPNFKCHKLDILMCVVVGASNLHFVMMFLDLFMRLHYLCFI
jgi:hypothetical protein